MVWYHQQYGVWMVEKNLANQTTVYNVTPTAFVQILMMWETHCALIQGHPPYVLGILLCHGVARDV
jgi:hypothetical protein